MSRVARQVRVSGRVQGVFFRDACSREASSRGVSGWVRNEEDGTVSACFEGAVDDVAALVAWCHHGPPRAVVDAVEVRDVDPVGHDGFTTR